MEQAATASLMRRLNRSAILNLIRDESPISRSEIATRLGMSLPTVMRSVEELLADDLVRFEGSEPSGGRRRPLLRLNGSAYAVIGVDLGGTKMYGTVTDLLGNIQHEVYAVWNKHENSPGSLDSLYRLIEELLDAPRPRGQRIRGIGVGAPGVTRSDSGIVVWAPALGWRELPLRDLLEAKFDLPVFVENDVNLAALGEYGFGEAAGAANLICITIGTGIGGGIIIDGKLYRGHNQAAGEVGYILPGPAYLGRRYDEFGALEELASGGGIVARARQLLEQENRHVTAENLTTQTIFDMARQGEHWAQTIVAETVDYLSVMIAGISALLDPDVIVLGGGVMRSADLLIEPIKKRLEGVVPFVPRIIASTLAEKAVVLGAIILVLDETTGHVVIDQRV